jgi:thioredoxin-related protein
MKILRFLPAALLFASVASASPAAPRGADPRWLGWNAGLKAAAASHRPVLVDVYTDWCGWCKRMDRDVYSRPEIREYLSSRFVVVRLDAESSDPASYEGRQHTMRSLAGRFRVSGYPTTIFLRETGEHLVNVPGYVPADRFLMLLRYVGDGHMERGESFEQFVRNAPSAPTH